MARARPEIWIFPRFSRTEQVASALRVNRGKDTQLGVKRFFGVQGVSEKL